VPIDANLTEAAPIFTSTFADPTGLIRHSRTKEESPGIDPGAS
jgi:hypothetical protein